jgi:hypothetical protein
LSKSLLDRILHDLSDKLRYGIAVRGEGSSEVPLIEEHRIRNALMRRVLDRLQSLRRIELVEPMNLVRADSRCARQDMFDRDPQKSIQRDEGIRRLGWLSLAHDLSPKALTNGGNIVGVKTTRAIEAPSVILRYVGV